MVDVEEEAAILLKERRIFLEEKRHVSSKISEICRFISVGLLIVVYTIRADSGPFADKLQSYDFLLFMMGICGSLAILLDYLQYVCGLLTVQKALDEEIYDYDPKAWLYWGRNAAFNAKQLYVGVGAISLVVMVFAATFFKPSQCQKLSGLLFKRDRLR